MSDRHGIVCPAYMQTYGCPSFLSEYRWLALRIGTEDVSAVCKIHP